MKTNHYFKITALLFLFIFLGCQKDKIILSEDETVEIVEKLNKPISASKYIEGDKIPDILKHLASKTNTTYSKIGDLNGKISYNKTKILLQHAMEVVNKGENTNYSFDLFLDDMPEYEFYSLVVSKTEDGTIEEPYVIGYKMTEEDYETYLAHDMDFKYFKAIQRFYTFDSFFTDTQKGMTGRSGDCGENTIGGGGSNNGGGGGGGAPLTAPGETFTSNYNGTMLNSNFGLRQTSHIWVYEQTINTPTGSSTATTTTNSASVSTVATTSQGLYNYPPMNNAGEYWLNLTIEIVTDLSGNSSANCWKIIGLGDGQFNIENNCPPSNQLKKGITNSKVIGSGDSDCFVTSGGVGINVSLLAVDINRMLGGIELSDDELSFLTENHSQALQVLKFLHLNNTAEDRAFAKEVVEDFLLGKSITNLFEEFGNRKFLNTLTESPSFQSTKTILEAATAASNNSKEKLYAGVIANNAPMQYSFIGESLVNGVEIVVQNNITTPISSLFHNHYIKASTGSPTDGRLLPTFSQADVLNFFVLKNESLIQNINNFNLVLVTPDQELHAVMVTDQTIFDDKLTFLQLTGDFQFMLNAFEASLSESYSNQQEPINTGLNSNLAAKRLNKILEGYGLGVYVFNRLKNKWGRP